MYQWFVFAHILGVFGFLLAHGTAAAVAFVLPRQREVERVRALLDLSRGVSMVANASLLVLLAGGLTAGFMGNWWGQGWIWTSLGLFVLIGVTMSVLGSRPLNRLRQLVQTDNPARGDGQSCVPGHIRGKAACRSARCHPSLASHRDWGWRLSLDPLADDVQAVLTDKGVSASQP
jgi:hypothetical protein